MKEKLELLKKREKIIRSIRNFFYERNVLEIESPVLSPAASVDLNLDAFQTEFISGDERQLCYLQSSPEFHMKRFLVEYQTDCFQLTKAFRNGEFGSLHNPEFSILEWYRIGFSYRDLMSEIEKLMNLILGEEKFSYRSYQSLFQDYFGFDVLEIQNEELERIVSTMGEIDIQGRDERLDYLFVERIEKELATLGRVFVYDYPASQAALAKLKTDDSRLSCRFELYCNGIELCNGFEELSDAKEQEMRFLKELEERKKAKKRLYPYDKKLITALEKGLPNCSGVAFGIDRLISLALGKDQIADVMLFNFKNA